MQAELAERDKLLASNSAAQGSKKAADDGTAIGIYSSPACATFTHGSRLPVQTASHSTGPQDGNHVSTSRDFSWRPPYLLCRPFMKSKNTSHTTMATPSFARMKRQHIALQPAIFRMSQILTCVVHSAMQSRRVEQGLASYLHSQHPAGTHLLARVRNQWFIPPEPTPFMPHGCDIFAPC